MNMIEKQLFDKEPKLKSVCDAIQNKEEWTLDNTEIIQNKLKNILLFLNKNHGVNGLKEFLAENEITEQLLTILNYTKASYICSLFHIVDGNYPGLSIHYLLEIKEKENKSLLSFFKLLRDEKLLTVVFGSARARLVTRFLNEDDKNTNNTNEPLSLIAPLKQTSDWMLDQIDDFEKKIKNFVLPVSKSDSGFISEQTDSILLHRIASIIHNIEFWTIDKKNSENQYTDYLSDWCSVLDKKLVSCSRKQKNQFFNELIESKKMSDALYTLMLYSYTKATWKLFEWLQHENIVSLSHYVKKAYSYPLLKDRFLVLEKMGYLKPVDKYLASDKTQFFNVFEKEQSPHEKHTQLEADSRAQALIPLMTMVADYPGNEIPPEIEPDELHEHYEDLKSFTLKFVFKSHDDNDTPVCAFDKTLHEKSDSETEVDINLAMDGKHFNVKAASSTEKEVIELLCELDAQFNLEDEEEEQSMSLMIDKNIELQVFETQDIDKEIKSIENEPSNSFDEEYDDEEEELYIIEASLSEDENVADIVEPESVVEIEAPVTYEWVTQKSLDNVDYENFSTETVGKVKKILRSITRHKPGLKIEDFSIFEELNEKCANFKQVTDFYHGSFLLNQSKAKDSEHFVPLPVLVVGDPGIGKTFYSKLLAKLLNTTSYFIDANSITANWVLSGGSPSWSNSKPGLIFKHLNECKTVSPIIIFDEMDKLSNQKNYDPFSTFHQLLEKENATNFVDEYIDLEFNASHIIYILSANNLEDIPQSLRTRMKVFHVQRPEFKESMKIAQSLYQKLLGGSPIFTAELSQENCAILAQYTPREMKQILMDSLYSHVTRVSGTTNNNLVLRLLPQSQSNTHVPHEETMFENTEQIQDKNKGYLH